jgi:hypothetical protein
MELSDNLGRWRNVRITSTEILSSKLQLGLAIFSHFPHSCHWFSSSIFAFYLFCSFIRPISSNQEPPELFPRK